MFWISKGRTRDSSQSDGRIPRGGGPQSPEAVYGHTAPPTAHSLSKEKPGVKSSGVADREVSVLVCPVACQHEDTSKDWLHLATSANREPIR